MRLFVGLDFPDHVKAELLTLQKPIASASWVRRSQLHLTLFFVGETEKNLAVQDALASVRAAPFDLTLAQVGRFPPETRQAPRVLWVGIQPQPALMTLQQRIAIALTGIGFAAESRPYSPHITLARFKARDPVPVLERFLRQHEHFRLDPFLIRDFVLFSSTLTPQGAQYKREAHYPLAE